MALRKASAYSKMKVVPFTRISKQKSKSYIKTVPPQSIVKFTMGSEKLYREGKFPHELTVVAPRVLKYDIMLLRLVGSI